MDEFDEVDEQSGIPEFLTDPGGVIRRRWPWMLAVFLVASVAAGALLARMPLSYEATARLLLTHQRISEDFVRPTSLERVPELVNAIVGEVLSRDSLTAVATAQNLPERMSIEGSMAELIPPIQRAITIERDRDMELTSGYGGTSDAFILAIRFESTNPVIAADVANELASRFTSAHLRRQSRQAKLTSDFLRRDAEALEAKLAEQRARITAFKETHRGTLPSELDTKLARLERLQQGNHSLALQIADAEGRLLILQGQQGPANTREVALEELRSRLAEERTIYTDQAPHVIAIQEQIEALEAGLAGEQARPVRAAASSDPAVAAVQREVDALRAQARAIEQEIRALDAAVAEIPARQEKLMALEQRHELLRERFDDATRKVQEAELAESLQRAQQGFQVSQLDTAIVPPAPKRSRWKLAFVATFGVLGASVMTGLLLEFVDPVILTSRQLETRTGLIPLGVIPNID
jgi:uncharacterized protein involved in exopolysaccharide biosynthesis